MKKHIYVNLKRFDVPPAYGGINRLSAVAGYGGDIVSAVQEALLEYTEDQAEFVIFFPEAHILSAASALTGGSPVLLGCQGVYREDVASGGNFGAFTTNRPAAAAKALGCRYALIGHCEERLDKASVLREASAEDAAAVNRLLNAEIKCALNRGLSVLYCIGEKDDEMDRWQETLGSQLDIGLSGIQTDPVVIAYEPVWSIGPGKTPAGREHIQKVVRFVKEHRPGLDVVYGGGLKEENARMLSSIEELDGGLIALTRFAGEIGFYPEEYLAIVRKYLRK